MNLAQLDIEAVHRFGEYNKVHCDGRSYTNTELVQYAAFLAGMLREHGVVPGDRVLLMMRNSVQVVAAFQAVWTLGAAIVPVLHKLTAGEVRHFIEDSGARVCIASPQTAPVLEAALNTLASPPRLLVLDQQDAREFLLHMDAARVNVRPVECTGSEMAMLLYTPGTAGRPKGVILTHANIAAAVDSYVRSRPNVTPCAMLHVLPLSHVYGVLMMELATVWGLTLVLQSSFHPARVLRAIQEHRIERMPLVPAMLIALVDYADRSRYDTSSLRCVVSGGAALSEADRIRFQDAFSCELNQGFGMSETLGAGIGYTETDRYRPGSVGHATFGAEVRIVDDDGSPLPPRATGEICVRGAMVTPGYWKDPDSTRAVLVDGWLHTGDIGYLDEDGYCFITDRKKDLIIKGGENISPREIERVLCSHPAIAQAAVVGVPDGRVGEEIAAVVVLRPGLAATADEIRAYVGASLARFKVPAHVVFEKSLPVNESGEVVKRAVAAQLAAAVPHLAAREPEAPRAALRATN